MSVPAAAQRKLVTVLFADLVGHTQAAARVGAEEWRVLLEAYFAEMSRPIERYGGTLEKFIGDAIFAVFGVPRAHEDDAERAVRAALEMQAALARLNIGLQRRLGAPLALRIGIATGEAVAAGEPRGDRLVVGELTSLAERLQREAPDNGVVLSERTHALVEGLLDVEPLGERELKGFSTKQRAYLIRGLRPEGGIAGLAGVSGRLVDREREVADLFELGDRLAAGHGQIAFLVGEAGLGKSRLIAELRARLGTGVNVLVARCYEFAQATTPYGVVVQHLRAYLGLAGDDPPEVGRLHLGAALHRVFGTATPDLWPALVDLLGLDSTQTFKDLVRDLTPDEVRHEVLRAIALFWERAAVEPLVLVIEDLHWIDASSAAAVGRLFEVTDHAPVTVLCALRPERRSLGWELKVSAERDHPHRYREVGLGPLTDGDAESLAGALLEVLALPVDLKTMVARRAEGNPFYVEELIRSFQQHGPRSGAAQRLPDTLQGVLQARLDALPAGTRRVLQVASVVGRIFPLRLVKTVSGVSGDLAAHITALQRTDFVRERQRVPEPIFAFKHVLLQEAAYHTLLAQERHEMHRRLAEALEEEAPAGPDLPALFYHFVRGEVWAKAVTHGERAATWAHELGAHDEALGHYQTLVEIMDGHPDAALPDVHRRTREGYGDLLVLTSQFDEARTQYEALKALADSSSQRAYAERKVGAAYRREGKLDRAIEHLQRALQVLPPGEDPTEEAWAHLDVGYVEDLMGGDPRSVLAHCEKAKVLAEGRDSVLNARVYRLFTIANVHLGDMERAMETAQQAVYFASQGQDDLETAIAHNNLADVYKHRGDIDRALVHVRDGLAAAAVLERRKAAYHMAILLMTQGELHLARGEWEQAEKALREGRHSLLEVGSAPRIHLETLSHLAEALNEQDRPEEALRLLDEVQTLGEAVPLFRFVPMLLRIRAEAYLRARDLKRAQAALAEALEAAQRYGPEVERPALLHIRARVAAEQGQYEDALKWLVEAADLFGRRGQISELGRVLLERGKIHLIRHEKRQATEALRHARGHFVQLGAGGFVEQIDRLEGLMR